MKRSAAVGHIDYAMIAPHRWHRSRAIDYTRTDCPPLTIGEIEDVSCGGETADLLVRISHMFRVRILRHVRIRGRLCRSMSNPSSGVVDLRCERLS